MGPRSILMLTVGGEQVASTRYRVLAYRPALEAAGFRITVRFPLTASISRRTRYLWRGLDLLRDVSTRAGSGLLFIQRKTYPPLFAARLRRASCPLIFDVDDAIDLPPPGKQLGPSGLRRYRTNFEATTTVADLVLAGNRELASRLPHDRYELLPTPIDTQRFAPGKVERAAGPVLGWVGHSGNLPYLEALAEPLHEVSRRHPGLRLIVVADRPPSVPGIEVEYRPWSLDREISCFDGIGIGLMPLDDSPWTRAKCSFKAIQYMALGIPVVASRVGMNRELIQDGVNGFLPGGAQGWVNVLDRLLSDRDLASKIGTEGRRTVERSYSLDLVSRRLVDLLRSLPGRKSRRGRGGT